MLCLSYAYAEKTKANCHHTGGNEKEKACYNGKTRSQKRDSNRTSAKNSKNTTVKFKINTPK